MVSQTVFLKNMKKKDLAINLVPMLTILPFKIFNVCEN